MRIFYDIYVLCEDRSPNSFAKFESSFLTKAEESQNEYSYPYFSDKPDFITKDLSLILEKLFTETNQDYGIYWRVKRDAEVTSAMTFFTDDGYIIFGLTVDEHHAENMLEILKKTFSTEVGGITFEQQPPLNSRKFTKAFSHNNL